MKAKTLFLKEILETPLALTHTLAAAQQPAAQIAANLLSGGARRFITLGSGSSFYASAASTYLHNALALPTGTIALSVPTADYSLYPLPLGPADALIGVSASGEIIDLLDLFEREKGKHPLVGITNAPDSTLTTLVTHPLLMAAGKCQVPTTTKTFNTSVLVLDLLWLELLAAQGVEVGYLYQELQTISDLARNCLVEAQTRVPLIAEQLLPCTRFFIFGSGPSWYVAQEAALVFKEIAGLPAEPVQAREMAHGAESVVDEHTGVIAIVSSGPGQAVAREVLDQCRSLGAAVVEAGAEGDLLLPACHDLLSPLISGSPLYILANELALLLGHDPDHPYWETNYLRAARRTGNKK